MELELISASATAAAAGGSAMAALAGDSLVVRNAKRPRILAIWADVQTAGWLQVVFPSGHDTTRNLRMRTVASEVDLLTPLAPIPIQPQETLALTLAENAVAGDVGTAHLLLAYDSLPGIKQRNITLRDLQRRAESFLTIDASITAAAGPAYSGEEALTAESDLLQANRDYAVLGYRVSVECGAIYMVGPDFGNLRIGGPGNELAGRFTAGFFLTLAQAFGDAIPVFNSANKAQTLIGVSQDENAAAVTVAWNLALLK